jgi:hypothetical protein
MPSYFPPTGLRIRMLKFRGHQRKTTTSEAEAAASSPHNQQPGRDKRISKWIGVLKWPRQEPNSIPQPENELDWGWGTEMHGELPPAYVYDEAEDLNERRETPNLGSPEVTQSVENQEDDEKVETSPNLECHILALPNELLHEILLFLRSKYSFGGFQKFLFVCKRFYAIGIPLLYTEVFYSGRTYHNHLLKTISNDISRGRSPMVDESWRNWKSVDLQPRLIPYHNFAMQTTSFTLTLDWEIYATALDRNRFISGETYTLFFTDIPKLVAAMKKLRHFSLLVTPQAGSNEFPNAQLSRRFRDGILFIVSSLPDSLQGLNVDMAAADINGHSFLQGNWNGPYPPQVAIDGILGCPIPLCRKLTSLKTRLRSLQIVCAHQCPELDRLGDQMLRYWHWRRTFRNSCPCTYNRYRKLDLGKYTEVCLNWYECEQDRLGT